MLSRCYQGAIGCNGCKGGAISRHDCVAAAARALQDWKWRRDDPMRVRLGPRGLRVALQPLRPLQPRGLGVAAASRRGNRWN